MKRQPWFRLMAVLAAASLVAAACGGRDDDDDGAATGGDGDGGELATGPGFDGESIRLGVITPTSGPVSDIGNALTAGNEAYFETLNEEGGVAGQYPVDLEIRDSQYTDTVASEQYEAIKEDVVMFAQILGTPIITTLLQSLQADSIVAGPATLDAEWVGQQNLLPIGAPYQVQSANAVDYWVNELDGDPDAVCALIQDDPYGEAGLEGVEAGLAAHDAEIGTVARYTLLNEDFTPQITQLQNGNCEMVYAVMVPFDTPGAMTTARDLGFEPQWMGQSPSWEGTGEFARGDLAEYMEEHFIWTADGYQYGDTSVPAMSDLIEAQEAAEAEPDIFFIFGYAQAWAVHQVLEAAVENGDLSRDGIVEAMNGLDEITVGGLFGDYVWGAPEDRDPPRETSFFAVNGDEAVGLEIIEQGYTSEAAENLEFGGE